MNPDPKLALLVDEICTKHDCHTVILYGSRARGEENAASDYDVAGIRDTGDAVRDARPWQGAYLDAFIYPLARIVEPDRSLLHMRRGIVLREKGAVGRRFLARLQDLYALGPELMAADEAEARYQWLYKTLERARVDDANGNYRRAWLLVGALEDFFSLRGEWYGGPKEGLRTLQQHHPELYAAYEKALLPGASFEEIAHMVKCLAETARAQLKTRTTLPLEIVPVTPGDAEDVRTLIETHWGTPEVIARGERKQPHKLPGFWVLESSRRVGLATYDIRGDACEIVTINNVSSRRGIGSMLVKAVSESARRAGCKRLWLITTNDNLPALRFYQRKDFSIAAFHPRAVNLARELKPQIPYLGHAGIPLRDEIELERMLSY